MAPVSFGMILREARERKGYDLAAAARRLRIRPDILRAIEENDFSRMPPRGYTRNMVNAYARLVGLNPTELTRLYLDEAYAYQAGRTRGESHLGQGGFERAAGQGSRIAKHRERAAGQSKDYAPRQNAFGRTLYDDRRESDTRAHGSSRLLGAGHAQPSGHTGVPSSQYTNFYAGPKAPSVLVSKLPFIIAGVIVFILLIIVLMLAFGNQGAKGGGDTAKVHITGVSDPTQENGSSAGSASGQQQSPSPAQSAPTSVKVTYTIPQGKDVWAVITTDGKTENKMLTGPVSESVDVSGTWSFATWVSDAVSITADGKPVAFDGKDSTGMPEATVDFKTYLAQWQKDHPDASAPQGVATSDSASTSNTTSSPSSASSAPSAAKSSGSANTSAAQGT